MRPVKLFGSTDDIYKQIEQFFSLTHLTNYELWFYDITSEMSFWVDCDYSDYIHVISIVSTAEHSFPEWIGINEQTNSYIVGLLCSRGVFHLPGFYKFEGNRFVDTLSEQEREKITNICNVQNFIDSLII